MQHGFKDGANACYSIAYVGAPAPVVPLRIFYEVRALFYYWYHVPLNLDIRLRLATAI